MLGREAYHQGNGYNELEKALFQFCFETGLVKPDGSYDSWTLIHRSSFMFYLPKPK